MRTTHNPPSALRASVVAVHAALAVIAATFAVSAMAAEATVEELTKPTSTVEIGGIYVDKDSYKAGEYNGLAKKGGYVDFGFDLRGGGAYNPESGSTERYRIVGTNLGLDVRNLTADYARQGFFRVKFEYDELRRNQYDNYVTLWNNAGTADLRLPGGYPPNASRTGASGLANWNNIQSPNLNSTTTGGGPGYVIPALMHPYNVATVRNRIGLGGEVKLTDQWSVSLNARNEKKDGTKLTGVAMGGFKGALVPEPIDSDTTIVEAGARYVTKDVTFGLGYNTSLYRNHVNAWTVEYPFAGTILGNQSMMSSAPDNEMHQVALEGSYRFSPTMKITAAGSYSRLTQNDTFNYQSNSSWNIPVSSANAKEIDKNLLLRLTAKPMKNLDVNASYKLQDRDNRTPIETFTFAQYDGNGVAGVVAENVPLNRKEQTFTLDGRYSLARDQSVTGAYEHQVIKRTSDNPTENPWASGEAKEDSIRLGYRQSFTDAISGQISYLHGRRRASEYEEATVNPPGSTGAGYYSNVPGFRQFYLNDRNRDKVRAAMDFQVSDMVSLQAGVDYIKDKFPGGDFGLKSTNSSAFNLEATVTPNDKLAFNGFLTFEDMKSKQDQYQVPVVNGRTVAVTLTPHTPDGTCAPYSAASGLLPSDYLTDPCRLWSFQQADKIWTLGFGAKYGGLMSGKLTLSLDATYSDAKTNLNFTGGTYFSNGIGQYVYIPAQNMPEITSRITDLKFGAKYDVSKNSALRFTWLHRRLRSSDPQFDLFGITSVQAYIGPGITSPQYNVNAFALTYVYTFR
jgi:MtrB/PioB family decaheme-associated outer membrane protein